MSEISFVISGAEIEPVISIYTSSTFFELKQKIESYTGIQVPRQTLKFASSKLKDSSRIDDHDFDHSETLRLFVQPVYEALSILVFAAGDKLQLYVKENDSVFDLKQKIWKSWGFDTEDMALFHLGVEMKDGYTLSEYYIHDGNQLNLSTPMLC